jgi:hypothetical protein
VAAIEIGRHGNSSKWVFLLDRAMATFIPARRRIRLKASRRIDSMHFTLEFADSELRDVVREGALVRLRFAAAAVRNEAGERGWLTGVQVEMSAATVHGDTAHAFGKIAEVGLEDGERLLRRMDVPGTLTATREGEVVSLAMRLANGSQLVISGYRLEAMLADDARFTDDSSC